MAKRKGSGFNKTSGKMHAYVAIVDGIQDGVPFTTYYKRLDAAERDARATNGTVTDLRTLTMRRYVNGEWRDTRHAA